MVSTQVSPAIGGLFVAIVAAGLLAVTGGSVGMSAADAYSPLWRGRRPRSGAC